MDSKEQAGIRTMIAHDDAAIRDALEQVLQNEVCETSVVGNDLAGARRGEQAGEPLGALARMSDERC
jgi:hypothetical protein